MSYSQFKRISYASMRRALADPPLPLRRVED
jgi:hypothetical protein